MKTLKNILSVSILPLLMLSMQHCDDPLTELEKLPPAAQSGKRTFGCLVDGKAQYTKNITDVNAYYQTGTFSVSAGTGISLVTITVHDLNLTETSYSLTDKVFEGKYGRYYDGNCNFYTSNVFTGMLTITHLDKINYIISGTFSFTAKSDDCSDEVSVTDGRFDVYYAP